MFITDYSLIFKSLSERGSTNDFYIYKEDYAYVKDQPEIWNKKNYIKVFETLKKPDYSLKTYVDTELSEFKLKLSLIDSIIQKIFSGINLHRKQLLALNIYNYATELYKGNKDLDRTKIAVSEVLTMLKANFYAELCSPLAKEPSNLLILSKKESPIEKSLPLESQTWKVILSNAGFDIVNIENVPNNFKIDAFIEKIIPVQLHIDGNLTLTKILKNIKDQSSSTDWENKNFRICLKGADNRNTYASELHEFYKQLKSANMFISIINNSIPLPTVEETKAINRQQYKNINQMASHLSNFITHPSSEMRGYMMRSFINIANEIFDKEQNLSKTLNRLISILCWLKRYDLVKSAVAHSYFIYFGTIENPTEVYFIKFLSRLPVNIINFQPNIHAENLAKDYLLCVNFNEQPNVNQFPEENTEVGTVAYNAERDLDKILYENTGIYRPNQFKSANRLILKTTYDEIKILWNQELRFRPGFSDNSSLSIPTFFSVIKGVKNGNVSAYWQFIQELAHADNVATVVDESLYKKLFSTSKVQCAKYYTHNTLNRKLLKSAEGFKWSVLSEDKQNYLFDKLEELLKDANIKGIGVNGLEYDIINMLAFNMPAELLRFIQGFDFTQKNPKLIYIICNDKPLLIADSVITEFFGLVGFDILFFIPSGFRLIEPNLNESSFVEYQMGNFKFNLNPPDLNKMHESNSWLNKIFRRG